MQFLEICDAVLKINYYTPSFPRLVAVDSVQWHVHRGIGTTPDITVHAENSVIGSCSPVLRIRPLEI
jgi:hypothetical protein